MNLKERFMNECETREEDLKYLIVAIQLPTGAVEIITNTEHIGSKAEYYKNAYDENFCLKANSSIKIINYMLV
jgi:hypothetical protein